MDVRLWVMLREPNDALAANLARYRTIDYGNGFLTVRAIKKSIDGALGSRGAWLLEPYSDKPGDTGRNTSTVEDVTRDGAARDAARLSAVRSCDRRSREPRNAEYLRGGVQGERRTRRMLRWRVEHAQHLNAADIPRFGKARGHRVDAGHSLHVRRAIRAGAPGTGARRGRRLRLAEADEVAARSSPTAPTRRSRTSIRSPAITRP